MSSNVYSNDLPHDILIDIFLRLSLKTIGRCRCVSKSWRALLLTRQFIKAHLAHLKQTAYDHVFLITCPTVFASLTLVNANQHFNEVIAVTKPLFFGPDLHSCYKIVDSFEGLVLVRDPNYDYFLINPTTREIRNVPRSPFALNVDTSSSLYGLGYDSINDDYKVAAFSFDYDTNANHSFVHIYSTNNDIWKKCETFAYSFGFGVDEHLPNSWVFLEKSFHWISSRTTDKSIVIAAFNVEEETFYELTLPKNISIDLDKIWSHHLEVLGGCLSIIHGKNFEVWTMKEYGISSSWTKLVSFDCKGALFWPLCLLGQENLILTKYYGGIDNGKLVAYNLKEETFKDIPVTGLMKKKFIFWRTFMKTLVSLGRSNKRRRAY